ncbi:LLM class flavin-dependent oxidoreductase [Streptomyces sp. TLI_171]|uniref:LLM class flavin-dependent oxidoreductase n=1 Tax=Streptomyces sp. TLI_171 TaxID=1938859 RepID=UPI000C185039|nr:LLM class flavin-dependent oxidoreductase [Streptomyces sp. TLI_171]RKE22970.1 putative F420-dependent oxidoreductase [Streptomyces sp. TLI_171]
MQRDGVPTLGRVGIWAATSDDRPVAELRRAALEAEQLGYGALWFGETGGREAMAQAAVLLGASSRITVACGMADVYARDAVTAAAGAQTLDDAFPGRFLTTLWESHPDLVGGVRGHAYQPPVEKMAAYLDGMAAAPVGAGAPRLVSALSTEMLELAARRADGALVFGLPVEWTRRAREGLGAEPALAVVQFCVLGSPDQAARIAAAALPNRRHLLAEAGYRQVDALRPPVVDALVAHGGVAEVAARVREQLAAGADHVALHVTAPAGGEGLPFAAWAELRAELGSLD